MDTHDEIPLSLHRNPESIATLETLKKANPKAYYSFLKNHVHIKEQRKAPFQYFQARMRYIIYNHSSEEQYESLRGWIYGLANKGNEELNALTRKDWEEAESLVRQFKQKALCVLLSIATICEASIWLSSYTTSSY